MSVNALSLQIATGRIDALDAATSALLFDRGGSEAPSVTRVVEQIISDVKQFGDDALRDLARAFDGVELRNLEVPRSAWDGALASLDSDVRAALTEAAASIESFHQAQLPADIEMEVSPGVILGRRVEPLARVGVYAPGGRAAYPSSVLMGVIPARVAGVGEVIVCTPPGADGMPSPVVLAACAIAGADRVFAIGGAGAIAAMAFGTRSVPAVARVVGPGNAYVSEAKRQLTGVIAIDSPAGPSEILVLADLDAEPELIAAEMIAQAEHDPDAAAVAVVIGTGVAVDEASDAVAFALEAMIDTQPRAEIIRTALTARGAILTATTIDDALAFAERYAPEHIALMLNNARAVMPRVRCAGTIFVGSDSSVAFGDYITGANHVLPTNRLARSYSGLSTLDFVRFVTWQDVSPAAAARLAIPTSVLARAEGLPGHANAANLRARAVTASADANVSPNAGAPQPRITSQRFPARAAYRDITLYEPGRLPCAIDLSDNTNLHGMAPAARTALSNPASSLVTRYPTVYARELKLALAQRFDVASDNVVTGCGSDDILDSMIRAFCSEQDGVAYSNPTFGVVDLFARMNAASPIAVAHAPGFQLDVDALIGAQAAVTYVCRPNNPTGTLYAADDLARLADGVRGVLAIDEAYAEYAGSDAIALATTRDNVVVVRTMSKAFGLAGMRVGYAIGSAPLIREIEKSRGPYKVGGLAESAALATLRDDGAWVRRHVAEVVHNRERLADVLRTTGLQPLPSAANFLLVPVPAPATARDWAAALREEGVAIRAFESLPCVGDAIRVSIGPWPLMERFVNALEVVRGRNNGKSES